MTDRFEVPADKVEWIGDDRAMVSVSDVPALVRSEVARALGEAAHTGFWANVSNPQWRESYLAQRYGEAAPEPKELPSSPLHCAHTMCQRSECRACFPTPSAPAEPKETYPMKMVNGHPRRIDISLLSPAENAIRDAMAAVEAAGAHPRLTDAVILLQKARDAVADFVDLTWAAPPSAAPANDCKKGCMEHASCVAAARPEAKAIAAMTGPELIAHLERVLALDAAERDFLRALAKDVNNAEWDVSPECAEAAHYLQYPKVVAG